ncbi:MAG: choice-of-anchor L domain-containing protein [Bacteroidia bacterium]
MKKLLYIIPLLFSSLFSKAQVTVTNGATTQQLNTILSSLNVSVSNIVVNSNNLAFGLVDASPNPIFSGQGLVLTNGNALYVRGPNSSANMSQGYDLSLPGDTDLTVASGVMTFDASIIEFDCVPYEDTLFFYYVFGSEEYPEYVNVPVNDCFGIFISGLGISGPYTNNAENFARIPGSLDPVTINDLNNGSNDCGFFGGPNGPCSHCEYYVDNCTGTDFQYDGFTTYMENIVPVTPGETYHVKLAVADGGDGVWDSGVFFPTGAFCTARKTDVGIEETAKNLFTLYPNPATSTLTIQTDNRSPITDYNLQIHNAQGQLVFHSTFDVHLASGETTFDISSFSNGIYFLTLSNEEQTVSRKFIKQ